MFLSIFYFLFSVFYSLTANPVFGLEKNKVIVKNFDWKIISTKHFDIYYYEESKYWLDFVSKVLEEAYQNISSQWNPKLEKRLPFFLYASINDMQQSNVADIGDGIGGITEPFKNRFMVYSDGSMLWLENVIFHEFAHEVQFSILIDGFWRSARILKTYIYPLWMMEGMAEYSTQDKDMAVENMYVRDAALGGKLIPLIHLNQFAHLKPHQTTLAYKQGAQAIRFLSEEYGKDKVAKMIHLFKNRYDVNSVLNVLLGTDIANFDRKFREHITLKYKLEVHKENLREPSDFGEQITKNETSIPQFNVSPAVAENSPGVSGEGGTIIAYISTRHGHPPVICIKNLKTKKENIIPTFDIGAENIPYGRFTKILRSLSVSKDGKFLVFSGQKNHKEYLFLYEISSKKITKIEIPHMMEVRQPYFSNDGQKIVFVGMKNGTNDLYELVISSFPAGERLVSKNRLKRLTNSPDDESSPSYSPDGKTVVYSCEIPPHVANLPQELPTRSPLPEQTSQSESFHAPLPNKLIIQQDAFIPRHHTVVSSTTPAVSPTTQMVSPNLVGLPDRGGITSNVPARDICTVDENGKIERVVSMEGNEYDPVFSPDGKRILFVADRNNIFELYEKNLEDGKIYRLTRTIGGNFSPVYAKDGKQIYFSSFRNLNVDIYRGDIRNFLYEPVETKVVSHLGSIEPEKSVRSDFRLTKSERLTDYETFQSSTTPKDYKSKFSTDLFFPAFLFSSPGGLFWMNYWQVSDMLGNNNANLYVNYNSGSQFLNYQFNYYYSRFRTQLFFQSNGLFSNKNIDDADFEYDRKRLRQTLGASYPFDRYDRFEVGFSYQIDKKLYESPDLSRNKQTREIQTSFIRDTINGSYLVATRGNRLQFSYYKSMEALQGNQKYDVYMVESLRYIPVANQSALVFRLAGAESLGRDRKYFDFGGLLGVRGFSRSSYRNSATRVLISNLEFRFPLFNDLNYYMWYMFPDFYFKSMFAKVFTDFAYGWNDRKDLNGFEIEKIKNSVGFGINVHTFILQAFQIVLSFDYAIKTNGGGQIFYFYLGPLF